MNLRDLRVFISYSRGGHGHTWAEKAQQYLEGLGVTVWRDEESIREGDEDWLHRIESGVDNAEVIICILGHDSEHCRWQRREMLRATQQDKPIVVLRAAAIALPLYVQEKQPVELRSNEGATLRTLVEAVQMVWNEHRRSRSPTVIDSTETSVAPSSLQRQRELDYLNELIHNRYSDVEERYVEVEGQERRALSLSRSLKGLRMDSDVVLRAFNLPESLTGVARDKTYDDVLVAYRELQQRPIRRLAVLGEPGAGKSFSLQRIALEHAKRAKEDTRAPVPLLVELGYWTRDAESLNEFIERRLGPLGKYFPTLRDEKRALLLLDGMNEIPPGQRKLKAVQIQNLAEDERIASVIVSCREKDFHADFKLPFDTLTLQPLTPVQIHRFLQRALARHWGAMEGKTRAEDLFWQMAGGEQVRQLWQAWRGGASWETFWTAVDIPKSDFRKLSWEQEALWRHVRTDPRSLLRLAANPYLLTVMMQLPSLPSNRAQLFEGFLQVLFSREQNARGERHDAARAPGKQTWKNVLIEVAETLQHKQGVLAADGAQTTLSQADWPASLSQQLLDFSMDASVLQRSGEDIRFSHQLLQEYLASHLLLDASRTGTRSAREFWPDATWWARNGWENVAEIAAEACGTDLAAQRKIIAWSAQANPEIASIVWMQLGQPNVPDILAAIAKQWAHRMTDIRKEPNPLGRAAIGRALGRFGLDRRKGVGLLADGTPDIDWVSIAAKPFIYQQRKHRALPAFRIARYPITNAQYQAFIAAGGYREARWWTGLSLDTNEPRSPVWDEPNAPRVMVSWYEAMAFCRWLSDRLGDTVTLPTEEQWERAARGTDGRYYPWGSDDRDHYANLHGLNVYGLHRTSAVGIYPHGASPEGVLDMVGNVWEWCLSETSQSEGHTRQVQHGGAWYCDPKYVRATDGGRRHPGLAGRDAGFRVCAVAPIE